MLSIKYKSSLLTAFFILTSFCLQAQNRVLNLDSVLHYIHHNNLMLQEHEIQTQALKTYAEGAKSWMAPMVGAGVFMYPYPGQTIMEGRDKGMLMAAAQQEIPNPAKLKAKEKYMLSQVAAEDEGHEVMANEFRAQAKAAYYQWVVLEKKKAVLQENQRIMQFMLKLSQVRYPYNQSSLGSIYKAEGRLAEVENMLLMNDNEIVMKNIRLNVLMNLPPNTRFQIDTVVQGAEAIMLADTAYLSAARSDIRQIDKKIQSMQLNQQLENLARKPDFSLRLEHMIPRAGMMPQVFTAMGMLSIPVVPWSAKMFKANSKAMGLEIAAMQKGRESLLIEAQNMVASMGLELQTKQTQVSNYETKIIPALRRNYETTLLSYEQNTGQLPLVIDAWEALNMAQMEHLNNLEQLYLIRVNYEKELEK